MIRIEAVIGRISSKFSELETNSNYEYLLLATITLLATALRFYKLGEWSFWIDEVYTLGRIKAHYHDFEAIIQNIPPNGRWIPLSLIFSSGVLNLLGVNEWSARLIPAMTGSLSIPVFYFPIKKMLGTGTGLISVLLLAVSPWHLFWSQNARFYTSLMFFYGLAMLLTFLALEQDRFWYVIFAILFLYLAMGERLTSLFYFPVLVTYLLLSIISRISKPEGFRWIYFGALLAPAIIFALYDSLHYLNDSASTISVLLDTFVGQPNHSPIRLLLSIIYRLGIPVLLMGMLGGVYLFIHRQRLGLFLLIAALLPIVLLLIASRFAFTVDRYIFITLPFWMILSAVAVQGLFAQVQGYAKWLALGVLVLMIMIPFSENLLYFQYQNGSRPDWNNAFQLVQNGAEQDDLIFSTQPDIGVYYSSGKVRNINSLDLESTLLEEKRIWFLIDEAIGWVEPDTYAWILNNSELIEVVQVYLPGRDMSIRIYLYDSDYQR